MEREREREREREKEKHRHDDPRTLMYSSIMQRWYVGMSVVIATDTTSY